MSSPLDPGQAMRASRGSTAEGSAELLRLRHKGPGPAAQFSWSMGLRELLRALPPCGQHTLAARKGCMRALWCAVSAELRSRTEQRRSFQGVPPQARLCLPRGDSRPRQAGTSHRSCTAGSKYLPTGSGAKCTTSTDSGFVCSLLSRGRVLTQQ